MDTSMDYKLSNAINTATEQDKIRTKELSSFPVCAAVGEVPSVILECLTGALKLRAGEMEIAGCCRIEEGNASERIEAAVNYYKEKRESGRLQLIDNFYVSIFLMENLTEVNTVGVILKEIQSRMEKMGFKERYRIGIYCFLDFENPASESKICSWEKLFRKEKIPVCFFSQQLWGVSDLSKYRRAVNAAALHIFLNISKEDWKLKADFERWKALGYWKLDIFKYVIAEQLEKFLIRRESESRMEKEEYFQKIEGLLFEMTQIDEKKMCAAFRTFPVRYDGLEKAVNSLPLFFGKNSRYTYREMLKIIYGDESAFYTFLKENADYEELKKKIPLFMDKLPGNIADIELRLSETLAAVEERLQAKHKECLSRQSVLDHFMQMTRGIEIQGLLGKLFQDVWAVSKELFECEMRLWFAGSLREYLKKEEWKQKLEEVKWKNRENIAFLCSVKREAILSDELLETEQELQAYAGHEAPELELAWNQDIMDGRCAALLTEYIRRMAKPFEDYMQGKDRHIFTKFIVAVQGIRLSGEDKFYTAYMDSAKQTSEHEYIFVNERLFGGEEYALPPEIKEKVKVEMPTAEIKYRGWVDDANIEMLAFKDLDTIRSIYGMSRKGADKEED